MWLVSDVLNSVNLIETKWYWVSWVIDTTTSFTGKYIVLVLDITECQILNIYACACFTNCVFNCYILIHQF